MSEYLAKPNQMYEEHIFRAYAAWKEITSQTKSLIDLVSKSIGISSERFLMSSLLTVVFHDIGKMCVPFQNMMNVVRLGRTPDYSKNYRHELASFPFVITASSKLRISKGDFCEFFGLEALAVLGHHKKLYSDLSSFDREMQDVHTLEWVSGGVEFAISVANDIFEREGFDFRFDIQKAYSKPFIEVSKYSRLIPKLYDKVDEMGYSESVRMAFALLKSILHYSDWFGSAGESLLYSPSLTAEMLESDVRQRCSSIGRNFSGFSDFQRRCGECKTNLIAVAPTGSGKTEASLLWAQNGFSNGKKLIYLLPTMVTSNSLFLRMRDYFKSQGVGLVHSTASLFKSSELDNYSQDSFLVLRERSFMMPVTVSTVDQLLFSGYNKGYWCLTEANAANSMIVIDEIHAYDGWTLGLICSAVKHFSKFGAKFMIMSATMPKYLKDLLVDCLSDVEVIEDSELLSKSRNRYVVFDKGIEEAVSDIESEVLVGKKVLVVVNNVALCQSLSRKLDYLNPVCYHSKFIFDDRSKKEKFITQLSGNASGCLVIATQVVEVSLDIDFDVLFTECAPPDALVQRGGRVNRARKKGNTEVRVYKASEVSSKIYDSDGSDILNRTISVLSSMDANLTESDLISFVETVYDNTDLSSNSDYNSALNQYSKTQERLLCVWDNPYLEDENQNEVTRKAEFLQVSVIPKQFKDEVLSSALSERRRFEVKMPMWYVRKYKCVVDDILFCDMIYDDVYGAQYLKDDDYSGFQLMV